MGKSCWVILSPFSLIPGFGFWAFFATLSAPSKPVPGTLVLHDSRCLLWNSNSLQMGIIPLNLSPPCLGFDTYSQSYPAPAPTSVQPICCFLSFLQQGKSTKLPLNFLPAILSVWTWVLPDTRLCWCHIPSPVRRLAPGAGNPRNCVPQFACIDVWAFFLRDHSTQLSAPESSANMERQKPKQNHCYRAISWLRHLNCIIQAGVDSYFITKPGMNEGKVFTKDSQCLEKPRFESTFPISFLVHLWPMFYLHQTTFIFPSADNETHWHLCFLNKTIQNIKIF